MICFRPDATSGYDADFDCFKLYGDSEAPQLYSVTPGSSKLTVNSLPFEGVNTVVPLGFSVDTLGNGSYSITASNLESFSAGSTITLEDTKEASSQELIANPVYTFNYTTGEDPSRFLLHFYNPAYGIDNQSKPGSMQIYSVRHDIYLKDLTGNRISGEVHIYNMLGQEISIQTISGQGSLSKITLNSKTGYYLVKLITSSNTYSGKVFITE